MRWAYADPPYPTKAHLYSSHPDYGGEVDHAALVARLCSGDFDGWALSTSSEACLRIWAMCPPRTRLAPWVRGPRPSASFWPLDAWEAVLYWGGRPELRGPGPDERRANALSFTPRPRTTDPGRVIGAKPSAFAFWLFELLGARPGDTFVDLYPGSGGMSRAWAVLESRRASSTDTLK
jgi:hypothetical protein